MTGYQQFVDPDGGAFGSFEVFELDEQDAREWTEGREDEYEYEPGWYWWSCSPGCLPDGEASGPFMTIEAAQDDANDIY